MTSDTRDVIDAAVSDYLRAVELVGGEAQRVAIARALADLDAKGLVIQSDTEADARVAAVERKGMERAAVIADRAAEEIDRDRGLSADSAIAAGIAAAIRADMEADTRDELADELMAMVGAAEALREDGEDR